MVNNYKIMSQAQNIEINPAGTGFMDVWEVTYKVTEGPAKGTTATITVPAEDHTVEYVRKAIEEKITALEGIAQLGVPKSA